MTELARVDEGTFPRAILSARWGMLGAVLLAAAPAAIFYGILFRLQIGLPFLDDYGLLALFNGLGTRQSGWDKFSYFLAGQHNEYKLYFENALAWLDVGATGHINFWFLCVIGNGFVLLLGVLLWKMFLPERSNVTERALFFVPVSCLLFQLQYAETLNSALGSLQNLTVLLFSLATIYLLIRETRAAYYCAVGGLILAVGSSGNGLLIIPIGAFIPAVRRSRARLWTWIGVGGICIATYAYHYVINEGGGPLRPAGLGTRLLYVFSFLGSATASPLMKAPKSFNVLASMLLGAILCAFFAILVRRGYFRKRPAIGYCVLFLLITAVGVSGIRAGFGVGESLASRYGIYSALLLIFAWFAIAEEVVATSAAARKGILIGAIAISMLFTLRMDIAGARLLEHRDEQVTTAMAEYEHSATSGHPVGPLWPADEEPGVTEKLEVAARSILKTSMQSGIYLPPQFH